jgi:hypothetical protein
LSDRNGGERKLARRVPLACAVAAEGVRWGVDVEGGTWWNSGLWFVDVDGWPGARAGEA